ncbi:MAG: A/G-specific adenine glycosylase [Akkermansiaceae bacterium]|nr:A/G-specific adenine glycosylase [Akkermansiaceae bacterium]
MLKPVCHHPLPGSAELFRARLCEWFARGGRDYPWRRTRDPYAILVSEVMLQQTQIATVLGRGFYSRFLERFPDLASLAAAADDPLLKAWEGLGYYRRARMLRDAARAVMDRHRGRFPDSHAEILALPGVGRYTAGAVLSFAFDRPAPLVDGNVARVFSRLFDRPEAIDSPAMLRWLWETAEIVLDHQHPRIYNSALMELGQTVCRPGVPDCLSCPVADFCATREPETLPRKSKKAVSEDIAEHAACAVADGLILLRRLGKGRREGMWRLPERTAAELAAFPVVHQRKYAITRYRVTLHVHQVPAGALQPREGEVWRELGELTALVLPPADRAALQAILTAAEEIA